MQIYVHIHTCIYTCTCTHVYIYLHNSCMRACATVQQLPCHGSYCEPVLSLARTSCRLSFPPDLLPLVEPAALLLACCKTCQVRNLSKSTLANDAVAAVVLHKASSDHPRWCGPHPVCLWFTLTHVRGSHPRQKCIFAAIFAGFPNPVPMFVFLFCLHHWSNSCVCVSNHVYAFPSPSIFIHIYSHVHIYTYVDYSVMTPSFFLLHLQNVSVYPLLAVSPDVYTLVTPCFRVCISLIMCAYASYECTYTIFT